MRHRGFEPRTTWLKVKCSTNWANIPYAQNRNRTSDTRIFSPLLYQLSYLGINCGSRIWTYDLRVMSPTSFQTAPSRDISIKLKKYSFLTGWRWIRTTEAICSRFTVCPLWPLGNPPISVCNWHLTIKYYIWFYWKNQAFFNRFSDYSKSPLWLSAVAFPETVPLLRG